MKLTYVGQKLTVSEYLYLRESIGWKNPCRKQQEKALEMSLFTLTAYDDGMPVGMGRIIGDGIYDTIADVIVLPDYQRNNIGKTIVGKLLQYIRDTLPENGSVSIQLIAETGKEGFYEKLGFRSIPNSESGSGMQLIIRNGEVKSHCYK